MKKFEKKREAVTEEGEKGQRLKVPVKASAAYTGASVIAKVAGLCFTPLFTRAMSGAEYGSYALYMTVVGLITTLCGSIFTGSVMYRGYSLFQGNERRFTASAAILYFIFSGVTWILLLPLSIRVGVKGDFLPFLLLQILADAAIAVFFAEKRYFYSYRSAVLVTVISSIGGPLISLGLLRIISGAYSRVLGLLIASLAVALPFLLKRLKEGAYDREMWKYLCGCALPLLPGAVCHGIIAEADKLAIGRFMGREALAAYAVAHSIGVGLTFITGSLGSALFPWMMRKLKKGDLREMRGTVSIIFASLSALTVVLVGAAPEALALLSPRSYSAALPSVLPLALATLPSFLTSLLGVLMLHRDKPQRQSATLIVSGVLNALLNVLLVPRFEYFGAGLALLVSFVASAALGYYLSRDEINEYISFPDILRSCTYTVLLSALMTVLYPYPALRILLFTVPAVNLISAAYKMKSLVFERAQSV
ncbi:MAG: lipopolysaccharide biosynthesis protein [Clostridia bacterium]|nr:lipopolysaccharide biosynthesis protein [Clostridia bacterium]